MADKLTGRYDLLEIIFLQGKPLASRTGIPEAMITIGALAEQTATKVQTIRYYEQIGLMPAPERWDGGNRVYSTAQRDRLALICNARDLGFGLEAIRELLDAADTETDPCGAACRAAQRHRREIEQRITQLQSVKAELDRMLMACQARQDSACHVLESLCGTVTTDGCCPQRTGGCCGD